MSPTSKVGFGEVVLSPMLSKFRVPAVTREQAAHRTKALNGGVWASGVPAHTPPITSHTSKPFVNGRVPGAERRELADKLNKNQGLIHAGQPL